MAKRDGKHVVLFGDAIDVWEAEAVRTGLKPSALIKQLVGNQESKQLKIYNKLREIQLIYSDGKDDAQVQDFNNFMQVVNAAIRGIDKGKLSAAKLTLDMGGLIDD